MKKIIIAAMVALCCTSCEDFLDKGPLTTLSEASYWSKTTDAEYAVNGMYEAFTEFDCNAPYMDAVMTDLFHLRNYWECGLEPFYKGSLASDNGWISYFWQNKYQYIRSTNYFFENIDKLKGKLSDQEYNNLCGQARMIRAFMYLRLVQGFGDVPLVTQSLTPNDWPERTPVDQVMAFVFKELDQSIAELPENQSDSRHGRIFKYVAYAYKARAAMYYAGFYGKSEYYQVAADALKPIVESGKFELFKKNADPVSNFEELFWAENEGADNKEIIFSDQFIKDTRPNNISTAYAWGGWKGIQAQQNLIDQYECKEGWQAHGISFKEMNGYRNTKTLRSPLENKSSIYDPKQETENRDPRLKATFFAAKISVDAEGNIQKEGEYWEPALFTFTPEAENDCYFPKKLVDPTTWGTQPIPNNSYNNFPLVRYSDILLLYAEALNELGKTSEAVKYVNMVRDRVEMPDIACSDKDEMLEIIKHERKIELLLEQQICWDYRRWHEYERTMPYGAEFYGYRRETFGHSSVMTRSTLLTYPKYYLWPIPVQEIRNNKNMKQNEGW